MADAFEELESAIWLVNSAVEKLKKKNPAHELLEWEVTFDQLRVPDAFRERFGGEHIPEHFRGTEFSRAGMYVNYYNALVRAGG